jgi:L-ribulokinase
MTSVMPKRFQPIPENVAVYNELFQLYKQTHDAFGTTTTAGLHNVMKDLLRIRDRVRLG